MQSVQRACRLGRSPDILVTLAGALATLIDRRVRVGRETERTEQFGPEGNVLVWLDHPPLGLGPVDVGGRGVIVVMHDANQAVAARSFIVSYPVEAGGDGRQLGAVSDLLVAMGWSLLASNSRKTEFGHADTAVLDSTIQFGEQRLWLAEPVEATPQASSATTQNSPRPVDWSDAGSARRPDGGGSTA